MTYAATPTPSPPSEGWTKDDYNTPERILEPIRAFSGGQIGLDPCSNPTSTVGAVEALTAEDDSLTIGWGGCGLVFVNPPYSKGLYLAFARKIYEQANGQDVEIVALVPTNLETEAWTEYLRHADAICFLDKRVHFLRDGAEVGSPAFGSALAYFGHRTEEFFDTFDGKLGWVR